MTKKILLVVASLVVLLVPTIAGAYYYVDGGYTRVVYADRQVTEYVPYRRYVCDESVSPRHYEYGYYGYGYTAHRNCYYVTDYRLETRTVRVPVREHVQVQAPVVHKVSYPAPVHNVRPVNVRYEYPAVRHYNYTHTPVNTVSYYGYYYGI